jgi:hypothetical protein
MEVLRMIKRNLLVLTMVAVMAAIAVPASAMYIGSSSGSLLADLNPFVLVYDDTDWLGGPGDSWTYRGTLAGHVTYKFQLIVPWQADFDIKIYDENGNLVASGTQSGGADESVTITPAWTGPFRIVVYSYSGSGFYTLKMLKRQ